MRDNRLRVLIARTRRGISPEAGTVRKPVEKKYGANARYTLGPGETAYERRRREKRERES